MNHRNLSQLFIRSDENPRGKTTIATAVPLNRNKAVRVRKQILRRCAFTLT